MSSITQYLGQRIRYYRKLRNFSQEKLAECCGFHPTYIGQIERGQKNASMESIAKIASALQVPLSQLFEKLDFENCDEVNFPLLCYELVATLPKSQQKQLYELLLQIEQYHRSGKA